MLKVKIVLILIFIGLNILPDKKAKTFLYQFISPGIIITFLGLSLNVNNLYFILITILGYFLFHILFIFKYFILKKQNKIYMSKKMLKIFKFNLTTVILSSVLFFLFFYEQKILYMDIFTIFNTLYYIAIVLYLLRLYKKNINNIKK